MSGDRTSYQLADVIDLIGGGTPKTSVSEYWDGDIPWLSVKDFNNENRYVYSTEKHITKAGLDNSSTKMLAHDDIIISARGTVGELAMIPFPMCFNQSCYGIRGKKGVIIQCYLYYLLKNNIRLLKSQTHGSVFDTITRATFANIKVYLPTIGEQQSIATTLSCLDDKIELNIKMNKTLEEMAQAIFKRWFVDFEFPDENGNPYKSSGGKMVESELGMIPEGWSVGRISDLGKVVGGSTPSKAIPEYYTSDGIAWITPKDLSKNKNKFISHGGIDITNIGLKNSSASIMPRGTVLFSSRAPIGYIAIAKGDITTNQGFKSIIPDDIVGTAYVYYFLINNLSYIEGLATGSTFKEISGTTLKNADAIIPNNSILHKYTVFCNPIFIGQEKLEDENHNLSKIRDTLLPKLMSGEIRVPVEV